MLIKKRQVNSMKRIHAALLAMTAAAGIGLAAGWYEGRQQTGEASLSDTPTAAAAQTAVSDAQKSRYLLGQKDGRLAVFLDGGEEPEIVFNIYLHHLPDVDRMRLEEGIAVSDYQTLLTLIEDYTS